MFSLEIDKNIVVTQDHLAFHNAELLYHDENGQPVYKIYDVRYIMVDGLLHHLNDPDGFAEPSHPVKFTTTFAANTTGLASATNKYSDAAFSMLILTVAPMLPIVL